MLTFGDRFLHSSEKRSHEESGTNALESSSIILPMRLWHRCTGSLNGLSASACEDFSDIGEMSKTFLAMFEKVFAVTARVMVERCRLHKGIPLPIFDNVTISG
ncbi:hypothetical protein OSTOST_25973, partial [Ostertagia ostertagi]